MYLHHPNVPLSYSYLYKCHSSSSTGFSVTHLLLHVLSMTEPLLSNVGNDQQLLPSDNSQASFSYITTDDVRHEADTAEYLNLCTAELQLNMDSCESLSGSKHSRYFTESQFIDHFSKAVNKLCFLQCNVRSLGKKFDQFQLLLDKIKYDCSFIGICETWIKSNSSLFLIDGYTLFTNNRKNKAGGGVGLYISNDYESKILNDLTIISDILESIFIEIEVPGKKHIVIGEIYRPPQSNFIEFLEIVQNILSSPHIANKMCFIMGDFNANLLSCDSNSQYLDFLNLLLSNSFLSQITKPTKNIKK